MAGTGVFPVNNILWQVGPAGSGGTMPVVEMTSFAIAFDNNVEEWNPMEQEWTRRLMTAKSMTVSVSGKRNYGDPGNDFIASMAYKNGQDATGDIKVTFPNGATLLMEDAVFNVTESDGGESTDVATLNFEIMTSGEPTYSAAVVTP